jgi:hypothetical protein
MLKYNLMGKRLKQTAAKFCWLYSSLLPSVDVTEFQAMGILMLRLNKGKI